MPSKRSKDDEEGLAGDAQPVFYMAAHAGLGLMESAMPFLERGAKVFVYKWNPHAEEIRDYFRRNNEARVSTFEMSLTTLLTEIEAEEKEIVLLMTASPTYEFGAAQLKLYQLIRRHFPTKIVDIYKVGHCMYGCTSHAHDDACNFPVSYSRYIRKTLPYDAETVKAKYFSTASISNVSTEYAAANDAFKIFVCPSYSWRDTSYAKTSLLSNLSAIDVLRDVHENVSSSSSSSSRPTRLCVKFHPICYNYMSLGQVKESSDVNEENESSSSSSSDHPFLSIPPQDEAGLGRMMRHLPVVPSTETSALPFLESCDVAVVDLFSSMTFESLYFHPSIHVFAFEGEQMPQFTPDPQILALVHVFHDGEELKQLLKLAADGKLEKKRLPDERTGREFFREKYQEPDGREAVKVGQIRQWTGYGEKSVVEVRNPTSVINGDALASLTADALVREYQETSILFPTKLEMMATGPTRLEVEKEIMENPARRFVEDHRLQLRAMGLPKKLWQGLFVKVHRELFDAGEKFQIQMVQEEAEEEEEEEEDRQAPNDITYRVAALEDMEAESDVFLVDHAMTWTSEAEAANALMANPGLLQRIEALVGVDVVAEEEGEGRGDGMEGLQRRVARLMAVARGKADSYSALGSAGIQQKINFLNDEFGSKIRRCRNDGDDDDGDGDDERNVRFEVFFFLYQGIAFSVFWPAQRIQEDEEVVR